MKAQRIMLSLAIMISLILGNVSAAFALPPLPSSFYGYVTVDGANAPDASTVSAWINGVKYAEATVGIYQGQTTYSLNVPGDDSSTPELEGGVAGDPIIFYVNGLKADQTGTWAGETNISLNLTATTPATSTLTCESFDAFTSGSTIGTYSGWYDGGNGPIVTSGNGLAGSVGLAAATNIYNWTAHSFNWNAADFTSVVLQQDFKTDASGQFDDDRLAWTTSSNSTDSNNQFGVQLDMPNGGIVTYWRNGTTRINDPIVGLTGIKSNTWYRFNAEFIKLTATSARIDVSLVELDAGGNPTGAAITGSIADTSLLATGKTPNASYFTATTMWPSYKTYNTAAGAPADNPCYEVKTGTPPAQYTLTSNVIGSGTVTLDPAGGTYYEGTTVELTADPAVGYTFSGWSGDLTGTTNPASITMTANKSVTATFTQVPPVQLTVNVTPAGSGTVTLDPAGGSYPVGTIVQMTANPASGYVFSGWSGDLTGSVSPASITMSAAKTVTATFAEPAPQPAGICESFNSGFTVGQVVGAHAEWFDSGTGPVVTAGNGVAGSNGLAPGSSIFNWTEHPFNWNDPAFENTRLSMDFQTNANGEFDDDRMGWTIDGDNSSSAYEFGVQLDTVSGGDGGIVTYWRTNIDDSSTAARVQTPIVPLTALTANTWYRLSAMITKLTDTSAKIDVILTQLDASGNPTGTPITGTLNDTSTWAGGTPDQRYFTATTMWPSYKNHNATQGAADNACFDVASGRFAFIVTSDWHTIDGNGNLATKVSKIDEIPEALVPSFMLITGDFPHLSQTEAMIDAELGSSYLWYPVIGNHEMDDVTNDFNVIRDTLVPSLPNIVNHGPTGSLNTSYSFDYENAHFVVVNPFWDGNSNDHTTGGDIPAALNSWANLDLSASDETHKFVFIHTPPYPEHRHVAEDLDANPINRDAFISTLSANGVESIFSGHTHYYEHDTFSQYPLLGNMHQITNAGMRGDMGSSTVTYVLVEGNTTTYKVYLWNGSAFTLLEQWVAGGSIPSTPPAAPTALDVTAVTYARTSLTWSDNADNETGFEIERSTTGSAGSFSLLATVPANTTSYTDGGLTPLSEYCYRVRAVNAAGQSDYTNVDCATTPEQPPVFGVCEDFDTGFTAGQVVGLHADWFDGGSGPIITSGNGVAGSTGLAAATNTFTWTEQPFSWNDPAFQSVNFTMDFKSDGSGQFDDDRIGWTTSNSSVDSGNQFGVQLDMVDGGIVTYWRNGANRVQDPIVPLVGIKANTWYRFNAEFTKLTATSARIDVSLFELDASGNPTGTPITGSLADTSLLAADKTPNISYFTATTLWPSYKTYNSAAAAPADNACYETVSGLNTIILTKPSDPTNSTSASFSFTSTQLGSTFECKLDSGNFASCTSPQNYTGLLDGTHTFQVRAINGSEVDETPASYTWLINTSLPSGLVGNWKFDETAGSTATDSSGYGNNGAVSGAVWTSGKVNSALNFDGSNDYVQVPASSSLSLDTNRFTFATWLYADTLDDPWISIMQRSDANLTWFDWQFYAKDDWRSGHPSCRVDWNKNGAIDADEDVEGDIVLQTGTWYHIACTYDGTSMKMYIDGTLRDTTARSGGIIPNGGRGIRIGGNESWGAYFDGTLDETRIYNDALTGAEIQALMGNSPVSCHALTLNHTGQGSNPIASPANSTGCSAGQYLAGATINLTGAVPDLGSQIVGWTGTSNDASTAATNSLVMPDTAHTVLVNYSQIEYNLTITKVGNGSVTADVAGPYHYGDVVELTAVPDSGWTFSAWSGALTGTRNPASITMDGNKSVTATFIDSTAPETQIDSQPANPSNSTNATFTFSSPDAGASFECQLDGSVFAACTSPKSYTDLADGTHTFQVRAKDGAGNVDATPASYTWVITTVPAYGPGTYDDTDAAWTYTGAWTAVTTSGPYNGTDHYSTDLSATASFSFSGTGFSLKYIKYVNRGNIEVWLDGKLVDTINANSSSLGWQSVYTKSGLTNGPHTVVFEHGGPNGAMIDIDSIEILGLATAGTYDDTDAAWTYTGAWTAVTTSGPYNGTDHYSTDLNATASFSFSGTGFSLKYIKYVNRGNIEVWLDGKLVDTINANSSSLGWQSVYTKSGLTNGPHTVVFEHGGPNGAMIDIDSIQVTP